MVSLKEKSKRKEADLMEIYKLLKKLNARGTHKAIPARELASMLHTSTREVKRFVEIERRKHFICSKTMDGGGYYRPATRWEIAEYERQQENRIAKHAITLRLVRRLKKRNKRTV